MRAPAAWTHQRQICWLVGGVLMPAVITGGKPMRLDEKLTRVNVAVGQFSCAEVVLVSEKNPRPHLNWEGGSISNVRLWNFKLALNFFEILLKVDFPLKTTLKFS